MSAQTSPWFTRRTLLLAALLPAAAAAAPLTLHDDRGVEHRFDGPPARIVSLMPSLTELLGALGQASRLVGVDRYSNWPPEVAGLPRLGGLDDALIEAIVALRPDVVLASLSARALDRLDTLGLRVLRLRSDSHADVQRALALLAHLTGQPEEGVRVWARVQAEVDQAAARITPALRGKRVYFEIGGGPYAAGATSFIGQTLTRLGLGNIVPVELGPFPQLNPEFVVRAQPDFIMGDASVQTTLPRRPGWQALHAVRQHRLCAFAEADYEMLVRPGPRLGQAAALLARCLERLPASAAQNRR